MLTTELRGRIFPNGEFGISRVSKSNLSRKLRFEKSDEEAWSVRALGVHGVQAVMDAKAESREADLVLPVEEQAQTLEPIGLSLVSKSRKKKRGENGITKAGAKTVRNAAYLMENEVPRSRLSFLTVTLPSMDEEDWSSICENWSGIVKSFIESLTRLMVRRGLPGEVIGVTEIQTKRAQNGDGVGLHLHLLFIGAKKPWQWSINALEVRTRWRRSVSKYLKQSSDCYLWTASENLKSVKSSAQGYLGKYMSKGTLTMRRMQQLYTSVCAPRSWYTCTTSLLRRMRSLVIVVSGDLAQWLSIQVQTPPSGTFPFLKEILWTPPGEEFQVWLGVYGRMKPWLVEQIRSATRDSWFMTI